MEWHYVENGQSVGPISEEAFKTLAGLGQIRANTLVWHPGMDEWKPWGALSGAPALPVAPSEAQAPAYAEYAGFWLRAGASIIDWILIASLVYLIRTIFFKSEIAVDLSQPLDFGALLEESQKESGPNLLISLCLQFPYKTFMVGQYGATLGYLALRLQVVGKDLGRIGFGTAIARFFAELPFQIADIFPFMLAVMMTLASLANYLSVAFDKEKRAYHDMIAGTRVIRRP